MDVSGFLAVVALVLIAVGATLSWHAARVDQLEQWALAERRAINRQAATSRRQADDRLRSALHELDRVDDDTRRAINDAVREARHRQFRNQ